MTTRRSWSVYGLLAAVWVILVVWQSFEHARVVRAAERQLVDRAKVTTTTCGVLMRSRAFGAISVGRAEAMLDRLVSAYSNEVQSILLLNDARKTVAAAGAPTEPPSPDQLRDYVLWGDHTVTVEVPVYLGTNVTSDVADTNMSNIPLVLSSNEFVSIATNSRPRGPEGASNGPPFRRFFDLRREKPPFMSDDEYRALLQQNVHSFIVVMYDDLVHKAANDDLWIRIVIGVLGAGGIAGYGLAWRSMTRSSDLQLRLVRASEQNLHLKEMNLAAAGLAHETRNPLNIIRGLAQLIVKQPASAEIKEKATDIINQTDRVTGQLNEFINYSRPREVHRAPTDLNAVVSEVARTLAYDIEEKKIQFQTSVEPIVIEADEQLLRQSLFNLALNAIQAVPPQGAIRIRASRRNNEEGFIEVSDNGPGVPLENRAEIFKPYFTTNTEGAGLGLSIVQQIVLAHGWEIQCLPNEPAGALFRISHVKLKT